VKASLGPNEGPFSAHIVEARCATRTSDGRYEINVKHDCHGWLVSGVRDTPEAAEREARGLVAAGERYRKEN